MTEDKMEKACMCLYEYEKRMDEIMAGFSPINVRTIANTDAYRCYKDIQTIVSIDELVNQIGGQLLYFDNDLMNKFIEVVSNENFDMFNYVEYLKQNPDYQKFAEEHKDMGIGQIVFLYSEEHDKKIVKSLKEAKENYSDRCFDYYAYRWSEEKRINEKLSELDGDSDFKRYKSEFSSIHFPADRYVLGEFEKCENYCSVDFCSIVTGKRELSGGVPKECGSFLQKGALVIFDGARYVGANKVVTFYTSEGKLLGGYREVNMKKEIIRPKDNSKNIEDAQQKQSEEKSSKEKDMFLDGVGISDMSTEERQALFARSDNLRQTHPVMQDLSLATMCRVYVAENDTKAKLGFLKKLYQIRKGGKTNEEKNKMADSYARVLENSPELKKDDNLVRLAQHDTIVRQPTKAVRKQVEKS